VPYYRLRNTDAVIDIRRTPRCNNKGHWQKIEIYMIKYKDK
jgi:hypothetical protein